MQSVPLKTTVVTDLQRKFDSELSGECPSLFAIWCQITLKRQVFGPENIRSPYIQDGLRPRRALWILLRASPGRR